VKVLLLWLSQLVVAANIGQGHRPAQCLHPSLAMLLFIQSFVCFGLCLQTYCLALLSF
jgi:hypothetical protein